MATKKKPLHELPRAKGRAPGRKCIECGETKPHRAFGMRRRICKACRSGGSLSADYDHTCRFCGDAFSSRSARSTTCERIECRAELDREHEAERRRRRRRATFARKDV